VPAFPDAAFTNMHPNVDTLYSLPSSTWPRTDRRKRPGRSAYLLMQTWTNVFAATWTRTAGNGTRRHRAPG
jgi:hypothetical protein